MKGAVMEEGQASDHSSIAEDLLPGVYLLSIEDHQGLRFYKIVRQ